MLSTNLGHEIKNALVACKTFTDLLIEKNRDAEMAKLVRRELARIESLATQMLSFAGREQFRFSPISLHEILDHSLLLVQPRLQAKSISLDRFYESPSDTVKGDSTQLEQAFVNLFLNASDAMGPNGRLTVGTAMVAPGANGYRARHAHKPQLCVAIKDTGYGIRPEHLRQLFDPFFTTKKGGTGLGLAITRRIIQQHGGALDVESIPGHGATFRVVLPALPQSAG
jgi:two-component system NtrC family sensor kinase